MCNALLHRESFLTSRLSDYFSEKEFVAQSGTCMKLFRCSTIRDSCSPRSSPTGSFIAPANRMTRSDIALHTQNGKRWAGHPGKPMLDKDHKLVMDNFQVRYASVPDIKDSRCRTEFSRQVRNAFAWYQQQGGDHGSS